MAKKNTKDAPKLNINSEVRLLRENGARKLYFLWGPEDYLREYFLNELKKSCLPDGENSFNYRRLDGPDIDLDELRRAVDAMPFLSERTLVEVRRAELNKLPEPERFISILTDLPDTCTLVFVQSAQFEPDGRLKPIKALRSEGYELKFVPQSQNLLIEWIGRRFSALGKGIELDAVQRLIFVSGDLMSRLIPEIEKIAAYAKGPKVTAADVNAVAIHIPEANVFEMTDCISNRKFNSALSVLAELLADKNNEPIMTLGLIGMQMRRLYCAKLAAEKGLGTKYIMESCGISHEFIASKLVSAAKGYSLRSLIRAVELCEETDYAMKSSGVAGAELLKELVLSIAAEVRK